MGISYPNLLWTSYSPLLRIAVGRFIVSGNAGTFTHFDGVVHISCRFIHLIHIFLYSTAIKAFYWFLPVAYFLPSTLWKVWKSYLHLLLVSWCLAIQFVESVENLSTISVDKSEIIACFVESVEKLSPNNVDNLVENCAEVWMRPESGSILPQSEPGYRTFPGKCQVNWLPDILLG